MSAHNGGILRGEFAVLFNVTLIPKADYPQNIAEFIYYSLNIFT